MLLQELLLLKEEVETVANILKLFVKNNPKMKLTYKKFTKVDSPGFYVLKKGSQPEDGWLFSIEDETSKNVWLYTEEDQYKLSLTQLKKLIETGKYKGETIQHMVDGINFYNL